MKKTLAFILLFILSFSQALACWGWPQYEWELCVNYTWSYDREGETNEEKRIKPYRWKISQVLRERFDLSQKSDYENILTLRTRVIDMIESKKYTWSYKDALCAIHVVIDAQTWVSYTESYWWSFPNTVIVEDRIDDNTVDVYKMSKITGKSQKIYSEVEKITYLSEDIKIKEYKELLEGVYTDVDNLWVHYVWESSGKEILSYSGTRKDDSNDRGYSSIWWIVIFEEWEEVFSGTWNRLIFPNGDIGVYKASYILDSDTLLVRWSACGAPLVGILKNWDSQVIDLLR